MHGLINTSACLQGMDIYITSGQQPKLLNGGVGSSLLQPLVFLAGLLLNHFCIFPYRLICFILGNKFQRPHVTSLNLLDLDSQFGHRIPESESLGWGVCAWSSHFILKRNVLRTLPRMSVIRLPLTYVVKLSFENSLCCQCSMGVREY